MAKVYESPDGGETVYVTEPGSSIRTLVSTKKLIHWKARWYEWEEILRTAESNPTLADAINKVEMIYALIKKEG